MHGLGSVSGCTPQGRYPEPGLPRGENARYCRGEVVGLYRGVFEVSEIRISMPREKTPDGVVDYRIGMRTSSGYTVKLDGCISDEGFSAVLETINKYAIRCERNLPPINREG